MFTRTKAAVALVAILAVGAGAARAADPIDPRLYLPTPMEGENVFVAVIKVPELLKLDAVKDFRKKNKLDEALAKEVANVTLDDIAELVIVGAGNGQEPPMTVGLVRFTKDLEVKDMLKKPEKVGEAKKVSGYEVYEITETTPDGDKETTQLIKVAPATFAVTSEAKEKKLAAYLKQIAGKKPTKYPEAIGSILKGLGEGEVVFAGNSTADDEAEPVGFGIAVKVGETTQISGAMKMQNQDAAAAEVEKIAKQEGGAPFPIPNMKVKADGDMVKITGSANKEEMTKMLKEMGKLLPMGGDEE